MSAPLDVVYLITGRSGLTFECSDPQPLQADELMSQDLSLDLEDSLILVHAAMRLTVQNFLDEPARLSRLQHSNGKQVRSAGAKRPITHVVLIGESALKATFLEIVKGLTRNGLSASSGRNDSFG